MPYTTNVPGTTITAAYGNANIRDQVVTPFAGTAARTSAVASPVDGMVSYLSDSPKRLEIYDGSTWRQLGAIIECTSATRPTSPRAGTRIYETDTGFFLSYGSKWIRDPYAILMTANQGWANTTVYTVVTSVNTTPNGGMSFPVEASSRYVWELELHVQANSGVALAVQINYPAGASADTGYLGLNNTGSFVDGGSQGIASAAQVGVFGGNGATSYTRVHGQVTTAGTAGSLSFGFAQGTSNAATSFLLAGSSLSYQQVG